MIDYFYLHEKPNLAYTVTVNPPPADVAKAEFHKQDITGAIMHREPTLKKTGGGTIPFDLEARKVKLEDSPIFVDFTFSKGADARMKRQHVVVISLAEPAVRTIFAPPEAYPGESVPLEVVAWDAKAYDTPGLPTQFEEREPKRIIEKYRKEVKWQLEGEDLPEKGESIKTTSIKKEHLGKYVTAEGYLGDTPPSKGEGVSRVKPPRTSNRLTRTRLRRSNAEPATAQIAVPELLIIGSDQVEVGQTIGLQAQILPSIGGTYAWTIEDTKRVEPTPSASHVTLEGLEKSAAEGDVLVKCAFTSEVTGRVYRAEHKVTVLPGMEIGTDLQLPPPEEDPSLYETGLELPTEEEDPSLYETGVELPADEEDPRLVEAELEVPEDESDEAVLYETDVTLEDAPADDPRVCETAFTIEETPADDPLLCETGITVDAPEPSLVETELHVTG